jgi:NAD(P)-dependent dehydrogenase (short-subunit alcohol dehydrogenase family)
MAQTAAYELTGQNVRVNAICPGLIQVSDHLLLDTKLI